MPAIAKTDIGGNNYAGARIFTVAAIPNVGNDLTVGHNVGDIAIFPAGPNVYICLSNALGAAVWKTFTIT